MSVRLAVGIQPSSTWYGVAPTLPLLARLASETPRQHFVAGSLAPSPVFPPAQRRASSCALPSSTCEERLLLPAPKLVVGLLIPSPLSVPIVGMARTPRLRRGVHEGLA